MESDTQQRQTIWERIQSKVPVVEQDEIKHMIGEDLVDRNETLRQEAESLREILEEFQQQNVAFREQLKKRPPFPEHPARALLEQQIILLITSMKQSNNKLAKSVLSPRSKTEQRLKEYVLKKHDSGVQTPRTCHSGRSQHRPGTASSTRSGVSIQSAPADILEPLGGQLSVFRIEKITKDLRQALEEESAELLEDIEYLQSLLDMEYDEITEEKKEALEGPPAIEDLREYSAKLEKTWLMEDIAPVNEPSEFLLNERLKLRTPKAGEEYDQVELVSKIQASKSTPKKRQSHKANTSPCAKKALPPPIGSRTAQKLREKVHQARKGAT